MTLENIDLNNVAQRICALVFKRYDHSVIDWSLERQEEADCYCRWWHQQHWRSAGLCFGMRWKCRIILICPVPIPSRPLTNTRSCLHAKETQLSLTPLVYRSRRDTIDCSEGLLSLKLDTTQQLYVVRDETENIECVNLLSIEASSIVATYTGDSLLMSYTIPHDHTQRKFLIRFASTVGQTGRQHCEQCVALLSRLINITRFDVTSSSMATASTVEKSNAILSMSDMIKVLLGDDSMRLSSYYSQEITVDGHPNNPFLEKYLCDETFPEFVASIAAILETLKEGSK